MTFNTLHTKLLLAASFLFPALALSTRHGSGFIEVLLLLLAVTGVYHAGRIWNDGRTLSDQAKLFIKLWLASVLIEFVLIFYHGYKANQFHSPALRLVSVVVLILICGRLEQTRQFWYGLIAGCLGVVSVALYQKYHLHIDRATGFHNAIHFGNFSLAFGLMAFIAGLQLKKLRLYLRVLLYAAAVAGVLTSLLSGSRGGWLALALSLIPIYAYSEHKKRLLWIYSFLICGVLAIYWIPSTGVQSRVYSIYTDLQAYGQGNAHTSIGYRLEMFRASWNVFTQHYLLGVGPDFKLALLESAKLGTVIPTGAALNDSHNEILFAAYRGGLFGLTGLLLLYAAPLIYFIRVAKLDKAVSMETNKTHDALVFAVAGIVFVMAAIDFGMSVNLFTRHIGRAVYFVTVILMIGLCELERQKYRDSCASSPHGNGER